MHAEHAIGRFWHGSIARACRVMAVVRRHHVVCIPMKPSAWQYLLATNWLLVGWQWAWSFAAVVAAIWTMAPRLDAFRDPWFALICLVALVLSFLVGWFASIIPAWFVFGPTLYFQGIENGGPFVPGDRVYIIAGKHRGTISQVYQTWQHETVRVELGESEKARYTDIFATYQLIREKADEQSVGHGAADSAV